jgi:hypothetical protein
MGKLQATAFDYLPLPEGVVIQIENGWVKQNKISERQSGVIA